MKKFIAISIIFSVFLCGVPFLWQTFFLSSGSGIFASALNFEKPDSFNLRFEETGEIVEISAVDYLIGCLYAQIPVSYNLEALKAQAVCAYTYALRIVRNNALYPDENMRGVDLTNSSVVCQPYFTEDEARKYYADEYDLYYDNIKKAAEYGAGHIITYKNEPIYSVYHSVSTGFTNSAYFVWGRDFPYLKSVASEWDKEYKNYLCTSEMTVERTRLALLEYDRGITMPVDYSLWFSDYKTNDSGYVEILKVGDSVLSSGDMWRIFNLRSTAFNIEYTGTVFLITTKGYGHGVGMSQYGANYMAENKFTAEEILTYYFYDTQIK